jgi:hypothetical protein
MQRAFGTLSCLPAHQRTESYALFPKVSRQKAFARRRSHAAPAVRAELDLVGPAMRAERKVIDEIVDVLKFHS